MHFSIARPIIFSSLVGIFLILAACHQALDPKVRKYRAPSVSETSCLSLEDATIHAFRDYLENTAITTKLSADEKYSLKWMVSVLTNRDAFEKFIRLCSDDSNERNLDECFREAKIKVFGIHSMSYDRGVPLFLNN